MKSIPAQTSGRKRNTYKTHTSKKVVSKNSVLSSKKKRNSSKKAKVAKKYFFSTLTTVFVVVFSIFIIALFSFYKYLNQNFVSAAVGVGDLQIKEDKLPTLAYIVVNDLQSDPVELDSVSFMMFDRAHDKLEIYKIPLDVVIDIPGHFGENEFSKVFALGSLNSELPLEDGTFMVTQVISQYFGFKVDRFMVVSKEHRDLFDDVWQSGNILKILEISDIKDFDSNLYTNVDLKEFYNLLQFVGVLPSDRIITSTVTPKDVNTFDENVREITIDYYLAAERLNIALLNGTKASGIASFGTRVVENLGGRVIETGNAKRIYETSYIITDNPDSFTVKVLQRVFNIKEVISIVESRNFGESVIDRSDITVIFGFDMEGILY